MESSENNIPNSSNNIEQKEKKADSMDQDV
jgi:hypothetical protein